MKLIYAASPYAGDVEKNVEYARQTEPAPEYVPYTFANAIRM